MSLVAVVAYWLSLVAEKGLIKTQGCKVVPKWFFRRSAVHFWCVGNCLMKKISYPACPSM